MTNKSPKSKETTTSKSLSQGVVAHAKRTILGGRGYKNPPVEHRFPKGRSGNPKGRPKKATKPASLSKTNETFLGQVERQVTIREGEITRSASAIEAVIQAQVASACKGNALAQKEIINRHERATEERRNEIRAQVARWENYVAEERAKTAAAEREGRQLPNSFPHPDDVVIDRKHGVHLVGPFDEESLAQAEQACRLRDILLLQDALDCRDWPESSSDDPLDGPGTALLFAGILNDRLPERFQLSNDEFLRQMMRYESTPKRQLLKDVYRGWISVGADRPRGSLLPSLRVGRQLVDMIAALQQRIRDGSINTEESMAENFEDVVSKFMDMSHYSSQKARMA